jgi:hypothetical protein
MINTNADIITEVVVRMSIDTSTAWYTDTILKSWEQSAHDWAVGFHKWPFTEGRSETTYSSAQINTQGDVRYSYPEGWKPDSIRLLQIGGKRLEKISIEDYQIFREEQTSSRDRYFSDFGLEYLINPNTDVSGTIVAWGQYTPAIDPTDNGALTVFSRSGNEGNEAIVFEMMSYAYTREKMTQEATVAHQKAIEILEGVWKRYEDEQYQYKTKDRGMFRRFDVLQGDMYSDIIKRDQF